MQKKILSLLTFVLTGLLVSFPGLTQAFGVTPGSIEILHVLNTSEVSTEFYFSRGQPDQTQLVEVSISGSGADAIELVDGVEFTLPAGVQNTPYHFLIKPVDLSPGDYSVNFTGKTKNTSTPGISENSIQVGALFTLDFTVTNEALESFSIQSVSVGDAEQGQPIGFSYLLNNSGNVDTRPGKIEFSVTDELDPSNTYTETFLADVIPLVPAFSTQNTTLETQADLTPGLYATQIVFYDSKGTVIFTSDNIRLQITNLKTSTLPETDVTSGHWVAYGLGALLLLVLSSYAVSVFRKKIRSVPNQ